MHNVQDKAEDDEAVDVTIRVDDLIPESVWMRQFRVVGGDP